MSLKVLQENVSVCFYQVSHWSLLRDPAAPGSIPSIPKKISKQNIADVAEVNQWCCLVESGLKMLIEHISTG